MSRGYGDKVDINMSSFIGRSVSNFNSYDDPIIIEDSAEEEDEEEEEKEKEDEELLSSVNCINGEIATKALDKCISFGSNISSSAKKRIFSAESSKEQGDSTIATTIATTITTTITTKKPKQNSNKDWNICAEMREVKTTPKDNRNGNDVPSSSSSSLSSSFKEEVNFSSSSKADESPPCSFSSSLVYHNCSCNDKSLIHHIGSEFEDTETRETFKIVDIVKARDNRCGEET